METSHFNYFPLLIFIKRLLYINIYKKNFLAQENFFMSQENFYFQFLIFFCIYIYKLFRNSKFIKITSNSINSLPF